MADTDYSNALIKQLLDQGATQDALARVEDAAARGNPDACFCLALWLIAGSLLPRDVARARQALRMAADQGHPLAALIDIAFTANGSAGPTDWMGALARLRILARSDAMAADQIALIDAMALDAAGRPTSLPAPETLSHAPLAQHYRSLFTPQECLHIGRVGQPLLQPAAILDDRTGRKTPHPFRDSDAGTIGPPQEDLVIQALLRRLAAVTGTRVTQGEPLNVLRYGPGQQYRPHLDSLPPPHPQRILTALVYLNDDYAGGETRFDAVDLSVKGRAGDVLLFSNVTPDGLADPLSRHAGLPVRAGTKWIATRWIRAGDFDPWQ